MLSYRHGFHAGNGYSALDRYLPPEHPLVRMTAGGMAVVNCPRVKI